MRGVIRDEFDHVDALRRVLGVVREVRLHFQPDRILSCQTENRGIHRFNGSSLQLQQCTGVSKRSIKGCVADIDQRRKAGHARELDLGLCHERERAFGATQHGIEIKTPLTVTQVNQVVACDAAVEFREGGVDESGILLPDPIQYLKDASHTIPPGLA